ncbi:MAG: AAA family ATPase [Candidatus Poribacteria bacterium]|nr:AAA family ATPase [Candidatus Poribacteria bacterium]
MRLEKLYLDGFGHFHKYTIDDISDGVTVFYGSNEAGKSTLLAFIRGVLFGFPRNAAAHYPPLSGGRYGGRITVSDPNGGSHTIERFSRTLSITGPSGKAPDPKAALGQLTGGGITQDHFKNIFAFSLDELQSDDALNDSNIYSAGQGVPGLPILLDSLEDRRREIYHSRGRKETVVTGIVNKLREIEDSLKDIKKNAADYGEKAARKEEIDRELKTAADTLTRTEARLGQVERLQKGWDDWVAMKSIETRLNEIPQFDKFPEDPIPRLDGFEKQIREAGVELENVREDLRQADEAASAIVQGEGLLSDNDRIEEIRRDRSKFDSSIRDLPERQDELKDMENKLSKRLGTLGKEWKEANLHDIDTSVTAQDQVDKQDHQLKDAEESVRSAKGRLDGAKDKMDDLLVRKQDIQTQLGKDSEEQDCTYLGKLLDDRDSVDRVRGEGISLDNSVREMSKIQGGLDPLKSNLERDLADLGRDWNVDRLNAFDTSIETRQEAERFRNLLTEIRENARLAKNILEQEKERLDESQNALHEVQKRMPEENALATEDEISRQQEALRTSRSRLNEYERARINYENLNGRLDYLAGGKGAGVSATSSPWLPPILMFGAGGALVAVGSYLGDSALIMSIAGGAIILSAITYMLAKRQGGKEASPESAILSRQTAEAKSSAEAAQQSLAKAASPLAIDNPTDSALDAVEARLSSSEKALSAWKEAHERVMDAQRAFESQKTKTEEVAQKAQANAESESKAQGEWQDWLERHGLSNALMPDTVIELIGRVKAARTSLKQIMDAEQRISDISAEIEKYLTRVRQLADKYGLSADLADHQKAKSVVDKLVREFDRADKIVGQRDDIECQIQQHSLAYDKAVTGEKKAAENLASVQNKWHDWLQEHNIHGDFTPNSMREFIARAETAVTSLEEARRMRTRIATIERFISEFRDKVEQVASAHDIQTNHEKNEQVAHVADLLIENLENAETKVAQRNEAMVKRDGGEQRLERCEKLLRSAEGDLEALLQEGGASDSEDFRRRAVHHKERMDLEQQRGEHARALTLLSGPGEKMDSFLESLNNSDRGRLDAEYDELKAEIGKVEGTRSKLQEERGGISNILEHLAGEEESSVLRRRRNMLREQLQEHAREWSRLILAKTLLERTQQKFEQERQPDVIKNAQEFFHNVTDKRYSRLYAPIGEKKIMVIDADGKNKQPHELSRGTREQLYLALRFGLIRDLGERTGRLPVVIDEALVNFDPYRARLAAQSLELLAKTNQVLVFTCHPGMRDLFVDVAKAKVVNIR